MKVTIITLCLIGAIVANPISYNFLLESSDLNSNSTESLSVSTSSENNSTESQSSQDSSSNQSSESESLESSEDKTSEESDSQSDESDGSDSADETKDDSMGSEENVRKQSWLHAFVSVTDDLSAENSSSTEVTGQTEQPNNKLTEVEPTRTSPKMALKQRKTLPLVEKSTDTSDSTSESADTSEVTAATAAPDESSESNSSESHESSESEDSSKSEENSNASDSGEVQQMKTNGCVNGTQSCESEEYFFQDIGDDAHHPLDNLLVPDDDERELSLRR